LTVWAYPVSHDLNLSNRPVRTRMPDGVAGALSDRMAPYADVRPAWAHPCAAFKKQFGVYSLLGLNLNPLGA